MKSLRLILTVAFCLISAMLARADVLPPDQDTSSSSGKLTPSTGKAATLPVSSAHKSFVRFNLNNLPVDVLAADIANARLRIFFPKVTKPGDINVDTVATSWDETSTAFEPTVNLSPVAMFPSAMVVGRKFLEVDVTATVQAWRAGTLTNNGFALIASLIGSGTANVVIGAKEGSGSGYPCELEVEIDHTAAITFTGSLVGDVAGTEGATLVSKVGGSTAAAIHAAELLASSATNANIANTLVLRDSTGNFSLPFLRTYASENSPSFQSADVIAGSTANTIGAGVSGSVIAGGGATNGFPQTINAFYASIGGGFSNTITSNGAQSVIAGGAGNTASASYVSIGGGYSNTGSGFYGTIGGGSSNTASGNNSTVPGGTSNTASGSTSFAAGNRAKAIHNGSFVWGDSTFADLSSTAADQMMIRANGGVVISSTSGVTLSASAGVAHTVDATNAVAVPVGTIYRDNTVVAWGRVSSNALSDAFNVSSVVRNSAGNYTVTLKATFTNAALVPVVSIAYAGAQPTTAANVRFAATAPLVSNTAFNVFTNSGTFVAADADFTFIVTGR